MRFPVLAAEHRKWTNWAKHEPVTPDAKFPGVLQFARLRVPNGSEDCRQSVSQSVVDRRRQQSFATCANTEY